MARHVVTNLIYRRLGIGIMLN